jgi:ligand-binding sensor domain-containing protein
LIWSIKRDRKGSLWVGTASGLARLDGQKQPTTWTKKDGLGGDNVRWLGETSDGSIWAVTKPGGRELSARLRKVGLNLERGHAEPVCVRSLTGFTRMKSLSHLM